MPWTCRIPITLQDAFPVLTTSCRHSPDESAFHLDPGYCGDCYGAPAPANAKKPGCCNNCDEVREAYASLQWAFTRGENVEQCEREGYSKRLDSQRSEGCRIEGALRVNKVIGNFHIAPGKSFSNGNMHVHDLGNYFESPTAHTFTHHIHSLRFGPQLPDSLKAKLGTKASPWSNHHSNPLDDTSQQTDDRSFNFMYFVKVVSTAYLPLGWEKAQKSNEQNEVSHEFVDLGQYGHGVDGSIETHQYSVTSHKRSLLGGDDSAEGHKERLHARGGIPGVFFSYVFPPPSLTPDLILTYKTGHFPHEGHKPRTTHQVIHWLPDRCLCRDRRYSYRRRCHRPGIL
jgi:endoplasmic reticulum-Golgi intermediate compartment protein 3